MPEKRNHSFLLPLLLFLFTLFNDAFGDSNPHEDHDQPFTDWSQLSPEDLDWISAENVASRLRLEEIEKIDVQIKVNLILIGFSNLDKEFLDLSKESMIPWFEHVDDHTRQIFFSTNENGIIDPTKDPKFSNVVYDYKYVIIELAESVNSVFEAAINTFMRPTASPKNEFQIDIQRFEPIIESLIHTLNLKNSYSLLVWNSKKFLKNEFFYGYRIGLSEQEMNVVYSDEELGDLILGHHETEEDREPHHDKKKENDHEAHGFLSEHDDDHEATPVNKVYRPTRGDLDYVQLIAESDKWAKDFLTQNYLIISRKKTTFDPDTCDLPPTILIKDEIDDLYDEHKDRGHLINMKADMNLEEIIQEMINSGTKEEKRYLELIHTKKYIPENCLVENWIGKGRFAFIDLSAGPFTWGPISGGVGVKSERFFPTLSQKQQVQLRYISSTKESKRSGRKLFQVENENENQNENQNEDENDYQDQNYDPQFDNTYEYENSQEYVEDFPSYFEGTYDYENYEQENEQKKPDDRTNELGISVDKIEAEEEIFSWYLSQYCTTAEQIKQNKIFCNQLLSKFEDLEFLKNKDSVGPKSPFWNVGVFNVLDHEEKSKEGRKFAIMEDFASQMGKVLSKTLKHLITPAASFKEYKKITNWSFEVYLIQSHDGYDPLDLKEGGFDFDKFKKEILKLTESSEQEFSFVLHVLDQKDDPALSMAFQTSLHTANVVSYQLQGKVVNQTRTYLDSDHLRHQLVKLVSRSEQQKTQTLPIFIFSVNTVTPILIDKVYQARSLDNIVVAVQNGHVRNSTPYFCNGKPTFSNLRDPTKALLTATVQAVFGLVPYDLEFDIGKSGIRHDYSWSVGLAPDSITSFFGNSFSSFHIDHVRRLQTIRTLDSISETYNKAVQILKNSKVDRNNYQVIQSLKSITSSIRKSSFDIQSTIFFISDSMTLLDFETSKQKSEELLWTVKMFHGVALDYARSLENATCQSKSKSPIIIETQEESHWIVLLLIINIICFLLFMMFPQKRKSRIKVD